MSVITLFAREWVKAEGMAYVDDVDSPTTETEGSDFEGSDAEEEEGEKEVD